MIIGRLIDEILRQSYNKKQNLFQPELNNFVPIPLFCEKSNLCETEIHLCFWLYVSSFYSNISFGSYRMKLNEKFFASLRRRRKSQRCWQEVLGCSSTLRLRLRHLPKKARLKSRKKHCVLDDTMGMQKLSSCA